MKVDLTFSSNPEDVVASAQSAEKCGADGLFVPETRHDPFLQLALASQSTERIDLGTSVAIAFARNPMTVAHTSYDLQRLSKGRMVLGLGSQVAPHITRRYSMPWSKPAARMEEFATALRAIWHSWSTGDKLDFRGDFYNHTLMTPMFDPGPLDVGSPRIWIAGVGPKMTEAAGRVADGLICHSFTTADYLRDVTLPTVNAGRAVSAREDFDVSGLILFATGRTEEEYDAAVTATRERLAFYGSTPAYRPVLDHHGWGALHEELHALSRQGRWQEMGGLIDAEVLDTFAIVGELEGIGKQARARFDGLLTRMTVALVQEDSGDLQLEIADRLTGSAP
ncbi:TIGR03617 family F420-dependent LLM class oxidoreductase [Rhodococcus sp. OK302]|uniref:TIGR03617 family F420-dependent LLM class oxidoreductase n=1 Tax=Rhodococcus sp. OK302 TaxID=1882769 RepID=UPI000B93D60D|nr:TIGR03617 family F420-dependent LLM class oxidoreductase [Rhodococcus sp. OK302]OYD66651.1 putative F420-dependent oxidoreductase [Rhodococcus sp. OK302]